MSLLNPSGQDIDRIMLTKMLAHWLSLSRVQRLVHDEKLLKQEDLQKLFTPGFTDKALVAKLIRTLLLHKQVFQTIAQALANQFDEPYKKVHTELLGLRDECKELARLSKAGLVAAGSSPQTPVRGPEVQETSAGIVVPAGSLSPHEQREWEKRQAKLMREEVAKRRTDKIKPESKIILP